MSKRIFGVAVLIALSLVMAGTLFAQENPTPTVTTAEVDDLWYTSPTKTATAGRFGTAADDYIGAGSYAGVAFDSRYMFAGFGSTQGVALGYAQRVGSLYVGAYYGGNMFGGFDGWTTGTMYNGEDVTENTLPQVPGWANNQGTYTTNRDRVAVLIGLANMGFRLSWASSYRKFSASDVVSGGEMDMMEGKKGFMAPQLAWSMASNLTANGIKPNVTADFYIWKNEYRSQVKDGDEIVAYSNNAMMPKINVGLGGYNFYTGDALTLGADLGYTFAIALYKSDFMYMDEADPKIGSVKGFYDGGSTIYEQTWNQHKIAPSVNASYNAADNLVLKAELAIPVTITKATRTDMAVKYNDEGASDGDLEKWGNVTEKSVIGLAPELSLGMQYIIFENRLALNVGGKVNPGTITWTTYSNETYTEDVSDDDSAEEWKSRTHTAGLSNVSLGVTWNISDNVTLDAMTGIKDDTNFNVFGLADGSLTYFGSIMAGLKF